MNLHEEMTFRSTGYKESVSTQPMMDSVRRDLDRSLSVETISLALPAGVVTDSLMKRVDVKEKYL